ncbi:hypothetical protein ABPG75_006299 [Micractinium tetrahymenae]
MAAGAPDGSVVWDPTSLEPFRSVAEPICNASSTVGSGVYKGACLSMSIQYDIVLGQQATTRLGTAGPAGTDKNSTAACSNGQVMVGLNPKRYSGLGVPSQLTSILNSITPNCAKPQTVCTAPPPRRSPPPPVKRPPPPKKSPPPPKPSPPKRSPPPPKTVSSDTVRETCSCGYAKSLAIGFITKGGVQYASQIDVQCSNGAIIKDRAPDVGVAWQNTTACKAADVIASGPWKGACRALNVRYVNVSRLEAVVGVVNADERLVLKGQPGESCMHGQTSWQQSSFGTCRAGTGSYVRSCPAAAGGIVGVTFRRYAVGPTTLTSVMNGVSVVCANEAPGIQPMCGPKKPPPRPPPTKKPPPPFQVARGWGDPHFDGFDGSRFDFHGVPGNWYELLGSKAPDMSLKTQVEQSVRLPQYTYMRAFELRINTTIVGIQLLPPLPSKPEVWRIMATANGQPVASTLTLANGIKVDRVAGDIGKFGTVKVNAGFLFISAIQRWRPDRSELAEFLDIDIIVRNRLQLPVTGILGSSYENALSSLPVAAAVATSPGSALAPLPAPLEAQSESDDAPAPPPPA